MSRPDSEPSSPRRRDRLPAAVVVLTVLGALVVAGGFGLAARAAARQLVDLAAPEDGDGLLRVFNVVFEGDGKPIAAEVYAPRAKGRHPALLLVHGADGLQFEQFRRYYRGIARSLARRGYVVIFPHYFDRTGTKFSDLGTSTRHFTTWMKTLGDALTYASNRPDVDRRRIGLVGASLGGYLSVSVAAYDPRAKAVVEYFGGVPPLVQATAKRMPPTLILHGDADPIVPLSEGRRLEAWMKGKGWTHEVQIYPGQGHGFTGAAASDSVDRTARFFDKHLAIEE